MVFQIYSDRKVLASALHFQLAAIDFTVFQDSSKHLPVGLSLAIDVRVAGAVATQPFKQPLADGDITLNFVVPGAGTLRGSLQSVQPANVDGKTAGVSWATASAVSFAVTAIGGKVSIDIAHTTIVAPLHLAQG